MRILILWMMVIVICLEVHDYWQVVLSKIGFTFNSFFIVDINSTVKWFHIFVGIWTICLIFLYTDQIYWITKECQFPASNFISNLLKRPLSLTSKTIERESLFGWIHLWLTQHSIWKFLSNWERCKNTFLWSGYHPSTFQLGFCDF